MLLKYVVSRALWKIDVHLISTRVNQSLLLLFIIYYLLFIIYYLLFIIYYYYYYYYYTDICV